MISEKERKFLLPLAPRIPIIYYLSKVHKISQKHPGRPVVSGIDSIMSRIGKCIDFFLQPLVSKTPAFLKDSRQIINEVSTINIEREVLLVAVDSSSLYAIIPHQIGYMAVRYFMNKDQAIKKTFEGIYFKIIRICHGA